MTGTIVNAHIGAQRHLRLCLEDEWCEKPESPQWTCCPLWGEGYAVRLASVPHTPALNVGGYRRRFVMPLMRQLGGSLATRLFRNQAAFLLEAALSRDENWDLRSFTAQYCGPVETSEQRGLVFSRFRLSGDAPSGRLTFSAQLIGKHEERITEDAPVASDFVYADEIPYSYQHGVAQIPDGTVAAGVEAFAVDVDNGVIVGPAFSDYEPVFLKGGRRSVSGWVRLAHDTDDYDDALREFEETSLTLNFAHPLGGSGGSVVIRLPKIWLRDAPRSGGPGDVVRQTLCFQARATAEHDDIEATVA
ncbi:MAG TPA: phage tail tube protein [Candidatus Brocadiia bacterium]|nr:phage tail tube protein [Candidatus Brocadiia bacterium]